jgi:hypothetical protein
MPYSFLVIQPYLVSLSDDGLTVVIGDQTGTYPDEPGGYAPTGEGTSTRPALNTVQRWIIYRKAPSENFYVYPLSVPSIPATFTLPPGEAVWQFVLLVVDDTFNYEELLDEGYDFDQFVTLATASGALGQLAVVVAPETVNCVNDARRRLNNAWASGKCKTEEYALKKALYQGVVSTAICGQANVVNGETSNDYYDNAQAILDQLVLICADEGCKCNC